MKRGRWIVAAGLVFALVPWSEARAGDDVPPEILEARKLSDQIDKHLAAGWAAKGVKPARQTNEGEFLRRAHLDLTGRIPRPSDLLDFRNSHDFKNPVAAARARENWINKQLLESPEYNAHFAATWRQLIVPSDNNVVVQNLGFGISAWLQKKFEENAHYDQIARELLTSPNEQNQVSMSFFQANQYKAEQLAATTSRLFLGVKLECAQCHNHPFARWSRQQFWEYAAFFSGVKQGKEDYEKHDIEIPGTEKVVQAKFLDGKEPAWKKENSTRETLAEWMLKSDNPFFARAAVNRFWAHFFGLGLVEPVDDLSDQNPASHPELLDLLAREFAAHDYDVKYLIRAITFSKSYQLSSEILDPKNPSDPRLFARMNLKGLTGEQLFDSIFVACDMQAPRAQNNGFMPVNDMRFDFLARFPRQENRTEYHTSILQALTLMNGRIVETATNLERCTTLNKIAGTEMPTEQRVEAMYLAVLSRKPRPDESKRFVKYIESGGPKKDSKLALADVFWALLNSGEFLLNH
jgi:hypothetical protein